MLFLYIYIFNFAIVSTCSPIVIDSVIYSVDIHKMVIQEYPLTENAIDYCLDDFLYVLTDRYLCKIDREKLSMKDRIPLPQKFNYLIIGAEELMLITTNEIVILDKHNFAFKSGIGIEYGDYRPLASSPHVSISDKNRSVHLITDYDTKSVMKVFDLTNGRLIGKVSTPRILSYECDLPSNSIVTFDINDRLSFYDTNLRKKGSIKLKFACRCLRSYMNGYLIYNKTGVFFINKIGKLVDFQPVAINENRVSEKFVLWTKDGIVWFDSLTLRPKAFIQNDKPIRELFQGQAEDSSYVFMVDDKHNFYFINVNTMTIELITERALVSAVAEPSPVNVGIDSLWYYQLGAFTSYHNVVEMYDKIKQTNVPVFIDSADLYRIKFGGFQDKTAAIEIVKKTNFNGWFIYQKKIEHKGIVDFFLDSEKYILEDGIIKRGEL